MLDTAAMVGAIPGRIQGTGANGGPLELAAYFAMARGSHWGNGPLGGAIVGVDRSDAGLTAIAVAQASGLAFGLVAADGFTSELVALLDLPFGRLSHGSTPIGWP